MDMLAIAGSVPVIPVLTIERLADAVPLARALVRGGLPVLEITLRTESALDALKAIATEVPDAVVGAGTVLTSDQLDRAKASGAQFAVSPGCTAGLAAAAVAAKLPFLPGVQTISEAMTLVGLSFPEVLSGWRCRRSRLVEVGRSASGRGSLLPDRRNRGRQRGGLSRAFQCGLRRGLVGGSPDIGGGRRLGRGGAARRRGCPGQTTLALPAERCFKVYLGVRSASM